MSSTRLDSKWERLKRGNKHHSFRWKKTPILRGQVGVPGYHHHQFSPQFSAPSFRGFSFYSFYYAILQYIRLITQCRREAHGLQQTSVSNISFSRDLKPIKPVPSRKAITNKLVEFSSGLDFLDTNGNLYRIYNPDEPVYIGNDSNVDRNWELLMQRKLKQELSGLIS